MTFQEAISNGKKIARTHWVQDARYPDIDLKWIEMRSDGLYCCWSDGDSEPYDYSEDNCTDWIILEV